MGRLIGALMLMLTVLPMVGQDVKCKLDSIMRGRYVSDAPGAAIYISHNDSVIINQGYGVLDMDSKVAITDSTLFNIASVTKQFTTVGILKLHELGMLDINDSIAKFFPELTSDIWKRVKVKHLMSHSSGVADKRRRDNLDYMLTIDDKESISYLPILNSLKFEPGTEYDYINPTFQILSEIIRRVSGEGFEAFQKRNIFDVAGMQDAIYFYPEIAGTDVAHGYINGVEKSSADKDSDKDINTRDAKLYLDSDSIVWQEYDYGEETFFGTKSDGGLYCSIRDFVKWETALEENMIISKKTKDMAYAAHIKVTGSEYSSYQNRENTYYGFGWFMDRTTLLPVKIYHTGDNGGYQIYAAKYPEKGIVILHFENRNDYDRWSMAKEIDELLIEAGIL
ncbi:MAG: serine hydrolase domain-containing protein [Bacteroidales bacterium]